ncbi:MAG TPA: hypothetical protein VFP34_14320 [Microlunatus sp.]|nr:hypothetical protein [Microlunatus sp.]
MSARGPEGGRPDRRRGLRAGAALLVMGLLVASCSPPREEPGLFGNRRPRPTSGASSPAVEPTNRQLPVLGEQVWTSGEGLDLTMRFAVHAVRRMAGGTVLDWSVTPLATGGQTVGATVPSTVDLGLGRPDDGDQRLYLLDDRGRAYRPLSDTDPEVFGHCLCTPLWVAKLGLRFGETRLLQTVFAPLPADVDHVDVSLANSIPFWRVPVMAIGTIPLAAQATDLARAPDAPAPSEPIVFVPPGDPPDRRRAIRILDLQSGPSGTTLSWSVSTVDEPPRWTLAPIGPPVTVQAPAGVPIRSDNVAGGPQLRVGATLVSARWLTSRQPPRGSIECLCSHFGLWAGSLRIAGGSAEVATTYAPLPPGTTRVDVVLPGIGTAAAVPVSPPALDADRAVLGVGRVIATTWTYRTDAPPPGWPTGAWPTPLPDAGQLDQYRARVARVVDLPH